MKYILNEDEKENFPVLMFAIYPERESGGVLSR